MRYWTYLSLITVTAGAAIYSATQSPGDEFVGSWEKVEVVCDRDRGRDLSHSYDTERSDTVSVIHFKSGERGVLEEIHLAKKKSCTGRSEFSVQFLADSKMKLVRGPVAWNANSTRDMQHLGCTGEEKKLTTVLGYSYDPEADVLKLAHKDHSRVCKQLISVYKRI